MNSLSMCYTSREERFTISFPPIGTKMSLGIDPVVVFDARPEHRMRRLKPIERDFACG
jgi:hypothetical protein